MDVSEVKVLARRANGILFVAPVFILLSGFALVYSILVLADVIVPDKETLFTIYLFSFFSSPRYATSYFNRAWAYEFTNSYSDFDREFIEKGRFGYIYDFGIDSRDTFDFILWECVISSLLWLILLSIPFFSRLFTPRTIMEYDDFGVYIYKTSKPVTLLRYEELWSTYSEEDFENVEFCYRRGLYRCRNIRVSNPFWGIFKTGSIRIEVPDGFINLGGIYHVKEVEKEIKRMVRKNRKEFLYEMYEGIEKNQRQREREELAKHNPDT